jgi:hypothetical protein
MRDRAVEFVEVAQLVQRGGDLAVRQVGHPTSLGPATVLKRPGPRPIP